MKMPIKMKMTMEMKIKIKMKMTMKMKMLMVALNYASWLARASTPMQFVRASRSCAKTGFPVGQRIRGHLCETSCKTRILGAQE